MAGSRVCAGAPQGKSEFVLDPWSEGPGDIRDNPNRLNIPILCPFPWKNTNKWIIGRAQKISPAGIRGEFGLVRSGKGSALEFGMFPFLLMLNPQGQ